MEKKNTPPQSSLILRILGGGYLVYLAYDLFKGNTGGDTLILAASVVFGLVGAVLLAFSLHSLMTNRYFYNDPKEDSPQEEPEDEA